MQSRAEQRECDRAVQRVCRSSSEQSERVCACESRERVSRAEIQQGRERERESFRAVQSRECVRAEQRAEQRVCACVRESREREW